VRLTLVFLAGLCIAGAHAQSGPTDPKAQKTYAEAQDMLKNHQYAFALDAFKKAAKQDSHCIACDQQIIDLGLEREDYKSAMAAGQQIITLVQNPKDNATAHYMFACCAPAQPNTKTICSIKVNTSSKLLCRQTQP